MNRKLIKELRLEMADALSKVGDQYNIVFDIGNVTFNSNSFTAKLKATEVPSDAVNPVVEAKRIEFSKHAKSYGLSESDFGRTFQCNGNKYKLVGIKPRATKYPMIGERLDSGQLYKFPQPTVKRNLI